MDGFKNIKIDNFRGIWHLDYQQSFRLYTIADTQKKGHQAYKYTFEGLQGACENDMEMRGMVMK